MSKGERRSTQWRETLGRGLDRRRTGCPSQTERTRGLETTELSRVVQGTGPFRGDDVDTEVVWDGGTRVAHSPATSNTVVITVKSILRPGYREEVLRGMEVGRPERTPGAESYGESRVSGLTLVTHFFDGEFPGHGRRSDTVDDRREDVRHRGDDARPGHVVSAKGCRRVVGGAEGRGETPVEATLSCGGGDRRHLDVGGWVLWGAVVTPGPLWTCL